MALWQSDEELFELARQELFPAVVGDVMDKLGLLQQFLPPQIKPLDPARWWSSAGPCRCWKPMWRISALTGPAIHLACSSMLSTRLKPNEVYICAGASPNYALWGGLMSTRARLLGAAGAVLDGYCRDS